MSGADGHVQHLAACRVSVSDPRVPAWFRRAPVPGGRLNAEPGDGHASGAAGAASIEVGDEPRHVVRFDAQGVLEGSKDAARCIGYLTTGRMRGGTSG
jgi:hypothetical protein